MAISLQDFKKWQATRKQAEPVKQAPAVSVIQSKPQATITGVVQAKPTQTIISNNSFIGPVLPKEAPKISNTFKSIMASPDMLGGIQSKAQSAISTPVGFSAQEIEQKDANPYTGFFKELPNAFKETSRTVLQSIPRTTESFLLSAQGETEPVQAKNKVAKFIYGSEPITPAARQTSDLELSLKDKGFGKVSAPIAVAGVVGSGFLDLYPGTSGKNKILREATTSLTEQLGKGMLKEEALNLVYKTYGTKVGKQIEREVMPRILTQAMKEAAPVVGPKVTSKTIERGFISNVKKNATTQARQVLADSVDETYSAITNKQTMAAAQELISRDVNEALRVAKQTRPTAKSIATAQALADKFAREGNLEQAIDLVEVTSKKLTQSGQAIQAASMFGRLTPEGVLRYAQRQFDQANDLIKVESKKLKLTPGLVKRLRTQAENLQKLPEGSREKIVQTAKMLKTIADEVPVNIGKKISLVQTMGQLLNPKTLMRNIIGNTGFAVGENIKDVVATPIDWFVSKFTGERTKALPSLVAQARGFKKGLKEGFEDAWLGIDTSAAATQFDLPKGQVFKNKMLNGLERTLGVALKAPDRAAYQAAFESSLAMQMKLKKVTEATPEMLHIAHLDGLYRTFQDDSVAAKVFMGIKKALNAGKDFGVGDVVLKYPKTPGNLLARGIDYSPAGFLKSIVELAKPLLGKGFDQRAFVESTSRALTGTASLVGAGALMHKLGLITGKRAEDSDINALQRTTGLGQYKLNMSGLARFVMSGFDPDEAKLKPGDKTISYDWFQPSAIGLSVGANIDEMMSESEATIRNNPLAALIVSLGEGVDTLGEQPLVQGITRPFKYAESISDAALNALQSVPTSFIPTFLGQIRQVADKNQRNIQDPDYIQETLNLAKNKIPGLSDTLPKKYGSLGEELKNENSILETFVSPGYVDTYEFTPEQKVVLDIYNNAGLKTQAPRLVSATQMVNGKSTKLTGEQQSEMQRVIGKLTQARFAGLVENPKFQRMSDEKKASTMAGIMSDIFTAAKYVKLGHRPKKLSAREKKYIRIMRETE